MRGIVKLKNTAPTGKDALFFVIHRAELRAVLLMGHEVEWSTTTGDYEAEFFRGQDEAPEIAAQFFTDLLGERDGLLEVTWENDTDDEQWLRNGIVVKP